MAKNSRFRNQVSKISKVKKRSNLYRTKKVLSKLFKKIKSFGKTKYNKCETVVTNYVENSKTMQNLMDTFEEISNEPAENKIIDNDLRELKSLGLTCKLNRGKFCHNLEANQNKSLIKQLCKINVSLAMSEAVSKGYPGFLWFKTDDIDNILPYLTQILNYQGGICKYFKIRYTRVNIDKYNIYLELPSYVISKYNLKCVNNVWHYKNSSYFRDLTENITKVNESTQYDNIYEYANNRSLNSNKLDKIYKDEVLNEDYDSKIYDSKIYESREYESQQCELKEYKLNDYENLRNLTSKDNENNSGKFSGSNPSAFITISALILNSSNFSITLFLLCLFRKTINLQYACVLFSDGFCNLIIPSLIKSESVSLYTLAMKFLCLENSGSLFN